MYSQTRLKRGTVDYLQKKFGAKHAPPKAPIVCHWSRAGVRVLAKARRAAVGRPGLDSDRAKQHRLEADEHATCALET